MINIMRTLVPIGRKTLYRGLQKKRIKHDKTIKYTDTEFLETNSQKTRLRGEFQKSIFFLDLLRF